MAEFKGTAKPLKLVSQLSLSKIDCFRIMLTQAKKLSSGQLYSTLDR
jgi:hypothetical protein